MSHRRPACATGHLTFGCFSSAYKLTEPTIAAYAGILRAAPASRLLLRNRTLDEASNRAALLGRFARYGVAADRLTLEGGAEHYDFLRSYDRVDVALDTFPYNGGTTTAEALWQGVPMLTCNGDRWAGRTSRSLLLAGGLDEWVAADVRRVPGRRRRPGACGRYAGAAGGAAQRDARTSAGQCGVRCGWAVPVTGGAVRGGNTSPARRERSRRGAARVRDRAAWQFRAAAPLTRVASLRRPRIGSGQPSPARER